MPWCGTGSGYDHTLVVESVWSTPGKAVQDRMARPWLGPWALLWSSWLCVLLPVVQLQTPAGFACCLRWWVSMPICDFQGRLA